MKQADVPRAVCKNCAAYNGKKGCLAFTAGHGQCANPAVKQGNDNGQIQYQAQK